MDAVTEAIQRGKRGKAMTREEATQALNEIFDDSEFSRYEAWYGTAMKMAIEALKAEPVKHGEWENTKYINVRKCSCCQAEYGVFSNKYWNSIEDFNFCPNCGAKMKGDKEK